MTIIFTLDDKNGTRLGNKRQSKDRVVADKIIEYLNHQPLYMKTKSESFFKDALLDYTPTIINDFYEVKDNGICFAEEPVPQAVMDNAEQIIVFRWNRSYPSLVQDRVSLDGYKKEIICEFPGHSHEKITMEVYRK